MRVPLALNGGTRMPYRMVSGGSFIWESGHAVRDFIFRDCIQRSSPIR